MELERITKVLGGGGGGVCPEYASLGKFLYILVEFFVIIHTVIRTPSYTVFYWPAANLKPYCLA